MTSNFYSAIHDNLYESLDKIFLKWPGQGQPCSRISGELILNGVAVVCNSLQLKNIKKGEKVIIGIPFSPDFVFAVLGIMAYGAIPVIPPAATTRFSFLKLLLEENIIGIYANVSQGRRFFLNTLGIKTIHPVSGNTDLPHFHPQKVSLDQVALISFSSGSTGKPKAVLRTHKILKAQHLALKKSFPPVPDQQDSPLFPNILLHNLSLGITTVIPDISTFDVRQMDPKKVLEQMENEKVDSLTGNVFYFKMLLGHLQQNSRLFPDKINIGIGGSPVPEYFPHLLKQYFVNANVFIIYGSTQAEPISIRMVKDQKDPARGYFVGAIHPDIKIRIAPLEKVKAGGNFYSAGEIEVQGKHVVLPKDQEWLKTGDFGYLDENGELYLTAREGNNVLIQGYSHYQIENHLITLTNVKQAAAIANKDTFDIFFEGEEDLAKIKKVLEVFPSSIFNKIEHIQNIPVDSRHHSKIIYQKLCTQNLKM